MLQLLLSSSVRLDCDGAQDVAGRRLVSHQRLVRQILPQLRIGVHALRRRDELLDEFRLLRRLLGRLGGLGRKMDK